jgi:hypothetical protein
MSSKWPPGVTSTTALPMPWTPASLPLAALKNGSAVARLVLTQRSESHRSSELFGLAPVSSSAGYLNTLHAFRREDRFVAPSKPFGLLKYSCLLAGRSDKGAADFPSEEAKGSTLSYSTWYHAAFA